MGARVDKQAKDQSWLEQAGDLYKAAVIHPRTSYSLPLANILAPLTDGPILGIGRFGAGLGQLVYRKWAQNKMQKEKIARGNDFINNLSVLGINADNKENGYYLLKNWLNEKLNDSQLNINSNGLSVFDITREHDFGNKTSRVLLDDEEPYFKSPLYRTIALRQQTNSQDKKQLEYLAKVLRARQETLNPMDRRPMEFRDNPLTLGWLFGTQELWNAGKTNGRTDLSTNHFNKMVKYLTNQKPFMDEWIDDNGKPTGMFFPTNGTNMYGRINLFDVDPLTDEFYYDGRRNGGRFPVYDKYGNRISDKYIDKDFAVKNNLSQMYNKMIEPFGERDHTVDISFYAPTNEELDSVSNHGYPYARELSKRAPYWIYHYSNPPREYVNRNHGLTNNLGVNNTGYNDEIGHFYHGTTTDTLLDPYTNKKVPVDYEYVFDAFNANPFQNDNNNQVGINKVFSKLVNAISGGNEFLKIEGETPAGIYGRTYMYDIPETQFTRYQHYANKLYSYGKNEDKVKAVEALAKYASWDKHMGRYGDYITGKHNINDATVEDMYEWLKNGQDLTISEDKARNYLFESIPKETIKQAIKMQMELKNAYLDGKITLNDIFQHNFVNRMINKEPYPKNIPFINKPDRETAIKKNQYNRQANLYGISR